MGLFGNKRREFVVTTLLRHMEDGRFADALRLLRKQDDGPVPPPHVLWRLGRWSLDKAKPKLALFPLRLFLRLYPNHQDRPDVLRDLAGALKCSGKHAEAEALAQEAKVLGERRHTRREKQRKHDRILTGRARVPYTNRRL